MAHYKEQMYASPGIEPWGKINLVIANTIVVAGESFSAFKALWQPGETWTTRIMAGVY